MSIDEKRKEESSEALYANVWECSANFDGEKSSTKHENARESEENGSLVSNLEDNFSNCESERSSCADFYSVSSHPSGKYDNADKISQITDLDEYVDSFDTRKTSPTYENLDQFSRASQENIYENVQTKHTSEFEEEIYTTIKYLENVLDSVDSSSEGDYEENLTEDFCENNILDEYTDYENFELEEYCMNDAKHSQEEKFTESSSSFGEYIGGEQLVKHHNQCLNQKFAQENRISVFSEEPEPISPQEIKNIPVPKRSNTASVGQRFSFPINLDNKENVLRPQSFPIFYKYTQKNNILNYDIENINYDSSKPTKSGKIDDADSGLDLDNKNDAVFDDNSTKLLLPSNSKSRDLNLSFAKESRISVVFEDNIAELNQLQVAEEKIFGNDLILRLKENAINWMTLLMEDCCGDNEDIMEEKV